MITKTCSRSLSLLLCLTVGWLTADESLAKPLAARGTAQVLFHAAGPAGLKIEGKTSELSLKDDDTTFAVIVRLAELDTGITLRNKHMREKYLEVQKYPEAVLTLSKSTLSLPAEGKPTAADATGKMMLHGKEQPVSFHYEAVRHGESVEVSGKLALDMTNYGITTPGYLGVTVRPSVDVEVHFVAAE